MSNTIIDDHRNMLMFSKNLSQFQINNLKVWPHIFFNGVTKAEVSWNFIKDDMFYSGEVDYSIETNNIEDLDKSIDYLISATKMMFWEQTEVNIKINGEKWEMKELKS